MSGALGGQWLQLQLFSNIEMYYLPPDTADRIRVSRLHGATFDNVQDYINFFGDRVIITGGLITATLPADGTVAVAPCTAWCKEADSDIAVGVFFDFAGAGNIALTDLAANVLYLDYNAGTPQVVVAASPLTYGFQQDHILLGAVYRNGNAVHIVNADRLGIQGDNRSHMMRVEEGASRTSGMIALAAGVRNLTVTAGVLHLGLNRITTPARDTTPAGGDTFTYWYYDGSLPAPAWVAVPSTQISNAQWNDVALGLVAFTPNRYGTHWVFMDFDGHLHIVYGQGDYTAAQAENADVPAALPNIALMFSVIVAKIICQQGAAVLTITYPWTFPFISALANNHSLLTNLAADDHLQYLNIARHDLVARHPLAVLDPLVCSEAEAAALIAIHAALSVAGTHGSSVAAAINTLIHRDGAGRAKIANPLVAADIDNMGARDAAILVETLARALADFMHETITTPPIHGSTVAATFDKLVHRDPAGRAQIVNPAVNADIDNKGARDTAIAAYAAPLIHAARHEPGSADPLTPYTLPYQVYRALGRFMYFDFSSYDMVTEHTAGTGYTNKGYLRPEVWSGVVSGGEAALYLNSALSYVLAAVPSIFIQAGEYYYNTIDGVGFFGLALVDNHVIALNDVTKHAGFIFYVSALVQTVYASTGDGFAQTKTDLGIDPSAFLTYAMIRDATSLKFYSNWALVATHTTNIPLGAVCWKASIKSAENLDARLDMRNFVYGHV